LLADGSQETIPLQTNNGLTGYKITKFQIISASPGANIDAVVKIWKSLPGTATGTVDFSDNRLLGVAWTYNDTYETDRTVIFDNEIFNQDIYVQHYDDKATTACNYYMELEQMDLTLDEATVATLKDIRNTGTQ